MQNATTQAHHQHLTVRLTMRKCSYDFTLILRMFLIFYRFLKGNGAMILLRRDQGNLVPYIHALALALPGNQTMSLFAERSRDVRKSHLWKLVNEKGETQVSCF